jgi:hypothetical protein
MALVTIVFMFHMFRYSTGVYADPSSFADVASLFHHPDMIDDLRQARGASTASLVQIRRFLGRGRYRLNFYRDQDGFKKYGTTPEYSRQQATYNPRQSGQVSVRQIDCPTIEENIKFRRPYLAGALGLIFSLLESTPYHRLLQISGYRQCI